MKGPKIVTIDIETSPIIAQVWGLYDNNVALNQVLEDWKLISFAAKWHHIKDVIQYDVGKVTEERLVSELWYILDAADIVVGQNSNKFDIKKINAKFEEYGWRPPSSFQKIDIMLLAKKHFGFTSNKLEYVAKKFNKKYKKLKHNEFPGQELWNECRKGNPKAWRAMRKYNIYDALATEERYDSIKKWDNTVNFNVYYDEPTCTCGNTKFSKNGYCYTSTGKYQRYECSKCKSELKSHQNLLKGGVLRGVKR